ncbi:hypothetical protein LT493_36305 [Streptomyces tricolor]|nr:hypothetical protein [Streptomyces tricolor]
MAATHPADGAGQRDRGQAADPQSRGLHERAAAPALPGGAARRHAADVGPRQGLGANQPAVSRMVARLEDADWCGAPQRPGRQAGAWTYRSPAPAGSWPRWRS